MLTAVMSCQGQSAVDINHHPLQYCERVVWLPQSLELLLTGLDDFYLFMGDLSLHHVRLVAASAWSRCSVMIIIPAWCLTRVISTNCMRA